MAAHDTPQRKYPDPGLSPEDIADLEAIWVEIGRQERAGVTAPESRAVNTPEKDGSETTPPQRKYPDLGLTPEEIADLEAAWDEYVREQQSGTQPHTP